MSDVLRGLTEDEVKKDLHLLREEWGSWDALAGVCNAPAITLERAADGRGRIGVVVMHSIYEPGEITLRPEVRAPDEEGDPVEVAQPQDATEGLDQEAAEEPEGDGASIASVEPAAPAPTPAVEQEEAPKIEEGASSDPEPESDLSQHPLAQPIVRIEELGIDVRATEAAVIEPPNGGLVAMSREAIVEVEDRRLPIALDCLRELEHEARLSAEDLKLRLAEFETAYQRACARVLLIAVARIAAEDIEKEGEPA
jgi:hypothetical protein